MSIERERLAHRLADLERQRDANRERLRLLHPVGDREAYNALIRECKELESLMRGVRENLRQTPDASSIFTDEPDFSMQSRR